MLCVERGCYAGFGLPYPDDSGDAETVLAVYEIVRLGGLYQKEDAVTAPGLNKASQGMDAGKTVVLLRLLSERVDLAISQAQKLVLAPKHENRTPRIGSTEKRCIPEQKRFPATAAKAYLWNG